MNYSLLNCQETNKGFLRLFVYLLFFVFDFCCCKVFAFLKVLWQSFNKSQLDIYIFSFILFYFLSFFFFLKCFSFSLPYVCLIFLLKVLVCIGEGSSNILMPRGVFSLFSDKFGTCFSWFCYFPNSEGYR